MMLTRASPRPALSLLEAAQCTQVSIMWKVFVKSKKIGRTLHYTRGNSTSEARRAYIINCRPRAMVRWERENNYDHGRAGLQSIKKDC